MQVVIVAVLVLDSSYANSSTETSKIEMKKEKIKSSSEDDNYVGNYVDHFYAYDNTANHDVNDGCGDDDYESCNYGDDMMEMVVVLMMVVTVVVMMIVVVKMIVNIMVI